MKTPAIILGCLLAVALNARAGAPNGPNVPVSTKPNVPVVTKPNPTFVTVVKPNPTVVIAKPNPTIVTTKPNVPVSTKPIGKTNVNVKPTKKLQTVNLE
jgi:hypothetical protein